MLSWAVLTPVDTIPALPAVPFAIQLSVRLPAGRHFRASALGDLVDYLEQHHNRFMIYHLFFLRTPPLKRRYASTRSTFMF